MTHHVRGQPADFLAGEADRARGRLQVARDQVEGRAFAGAVGPNQAKDLALAHVEGHLIDRQESSEALAEPLDSQHRRLPELPGSVTLVSSRRRTTSAAAA